MNDDHAEALVLYCRVFGGRPATAEAGWSGSTATASRCWPATSGADDRTAVRIAFGRSVETAGAVRTAMIDLLREAAR